MKKEMDKNKYLPGVGLDIGTMNLISARQTVDGKTVETKRVRDAFIDLDPEVKKTLRMSKVDYVEKDGSLIVLGDSALTMANLFKREVRRPLSKGVIAAGELDAQQILGLLIKNVLGEPIVEGEHCYYSVPSSPVDDTAQDVVYHTEVFRKILKELGYTPHPMNEAMAIIYSQCSPENFSGVATSFGSGMANIALSYQTVNGLEFSVARCLPADFPVLTNRGVSPISKIIPGEDKVLDGLGKWANVLEVVDNGVREKLLEITLHNMNGISYKMTSDHKVFSKSRFGWTWKQAGDLKQGDTVGIPTLEAKLNHTSYYFGRKNEVNITSSLGRNLGRLFGAFLGDGSCGPYNKSDGQEFIVLSFDRKYPDLISKYETNFHELFDTFRDRVGGFGVHLEDRQEEGLVNIKLHSTCVAKHMKKNFYNSEGDKICPLPVDKICNQMALGILEGLFDSGGWDEKKRYSFGNTSKPLIALAHHLLNRFGIKHTILRRSPRRGGINKRGVQIMGTKDEYVVRLCGHVSTSLFDLLLQHESHKIWDEFPDFVEYTISSTQEVDHNDKVFDLKVESEHHSFATYGMLVHNCGDWIDQHAAKAVGATASRMCAIKEKGVDLSAPKTRDEEAIALYIRSLIKYTLENIAAQFRNVQAGIDLPEPVPFVVSGGTTKAGNFMTIFNEEFEAIKKKGFPIQISEVRMAQDPMTAVAEGLLVLASDEYAD